MNRIRAMSGKVSDEKLPVSTMPNQKGTLEASKKRMDDQLRLKLQGRNCEK